MNASPYAIGWLIKEEIRSARKLTFFEASCEAAYLISSLSPSPLYPVSNVPQYLRLCERQDTYVLSNKGTWIIINLKSADVKFEFET